MAPKLSESVANTAPLWAPVDGRPDIDVPDRYWACYFILYLLGIGSLLPWNALITPTEYFQLRLTGSPFIDQFELTKSVLELDDPQLAQKLLRDPGANAADEYEAEAQRLIAVPLALPAYEMVMKCSHTFNLLDARGAISVTERAAYIGRVRALSRLVAQAYYESREALGFPMAPASTRAA
jgi:hypothetical protein